MTKIPFEFKVGDIVKRIDPEGGSIFSFPFGSIAVVSSIKKYRGSHDLVYFDNGGALHPYRIELANMKIEGDDDEDTV